MKQLREKIEELLCNSKCTKEEISSIMREKHYIHSVERAEF